MRSRTPRIVAALCLVAALAGPALAQEGDAPGLPEGYRAGTHIVRPGETLTKITRNYLGTAELWRRNWELNPGIVDPDFLRPGQRLRVLLPPRATVRTARVRQLAGQVENKPAPIPWDAALVNDLLLERDAQRTGRDSSSELEFTDGTRLVLTENSLVFLPPARRPVARAEKRPVEIVEGQADLNAVLLPRSEVDVEILVGEARTLPKVDDAGVARTRARRAAARGAQVMVYEGGGEVEAAGRKVELERGSGTTVPPGAPPGPPEKLLPAPVALQPPPGTRSAIANPAFRWEPLEGAVSYALEICRDEDCAAQIRRTTGLDRGEWRLPESESLPVGELYWRVTGVAGSGLDGYPSAPSPFTVTSTELDRSPPQGVLEVVGAQVRVGDHLVVDEHVRLEPRLRDAESEIGWLEAWVNDERVAESFFEGPWAPGTYRARVAAFDRAGHRGETPERVLVVDAEAPRFRWETVDATAREEEESPIGRRRGRRWGRKGWRWLEWSLDGRHWRPLLWGEHRPRIESYLERRGVRGRDPLTAVRLRSNDHERRGAGGPGEGTGGAPSEGGDRVLLHPVEVRARLWLRAPGGEPFTGPEAPRFGAGEMLRITAEDEPVGLDWMELRVVDGLPRGATLELEAVDFLGHSRRLSWPLAR